MTTKELDEKALKLLRERQGSPIQIGDLRFFGMEDREADRTLQRLRKRGVIKQGQRRGYWYLIDG